MRRSFFLLIAAAFAAVLPLRGAQSTAFPLTTFETANYSIGAAGNSFFRYDSFQPNLQGFTWEIEQVTINVTQLVTLQVATAPNFVPQPPFGFSSPVPYTFAFKVDQEFSPFGGGFPRGFSTFSKPVRTFSGLASGAGGVATVSNFFNYTLVFDETSDLITGFEFSSGGVFRALREDFLPTGISDDIYTFSDFDATKLHGFGASALTFSGFGNFLIQYDGTLLLEDGQEPPAFLFAVPAVLPAPVLAIGFAAVCLSGWRRRVRAPYGA